MPPPVQVERLAADGHDLLLDSKQEMPLHTRQIEIDYAALSFVIPERVRFKYRLEGHDADWADAGTPAAGVLQRPRTQPLRVSRDRL